MKHLFLLTLLFYQLSKAHITPPIWGKTGHRVVGKIADSYLKNRTKRKISKLLNQESLALASTYADEIKSDKRYDKFKAWHYINMPFDSDYKQAHKNTKGDLVTGIQQCIFQIKNKNLIQEDKAFYLRLLIHLIGDLHQPLHIGRKEDHGGNKIRLKWKKKSSNLHKVWDTEMIESFGMSYSELALNSKKLSKKQIKTIEKGTVESWVKETHQLTNKIYNSVEEGENIGYRYAYDYLKIARTQLQIGGIRLAKILNELF